MNKLDRIVSLNQAFEKNKWTGDIGESFGIVAVLVIASSDQRAALGLRREDYRVDARLREIGFGAWEGLTFAEVRVRAPQALAERERRKWDFVPPGGESYAQVAVRMRDWHGTLAGDTVVVAHGGTARALIAVLGIATPAKAPSIDIDQGVVYRFADRSMGRYG